MAEEYVSTAVKGSVIIFLITVLSSLLGYFIRMVLAKQLSVADFGLFFSVLTLINFLWLFKHFGLNSALVKFIPEYRAKNDFKSIAQALFFVLVLELFFTIFIFLILWLADNFLAFHYFHSLSAANLILLLAGYFLFSTFTDILVSSLLGFNKYTYYSLYFILQNLLVLLFILFFTDELGVVSPALGYLISSIVLSLLFIFIFLKFFPLFKYPFSFSRPIGKVLLSFSLPLALGMLSAKVIGYIDVIILTYFRSLEEVGVYNVVLPTALLLTTVGSSLAAILLPLVSELNTRKMHQELSYGTKIIFKYVFILIVPLFSLLFLFPDFVLTIFFGPAYVMGVLAMQVLIVGALFYSIGMLNMAILNGLGNPQIVTKIIVISALVNVIVNLILIPFYGMVGAAVSTSVSYFLIFLFSARELSKKMELRLPWFSWLKVLLCGVLTASLTIFLKELLHFSLWAEVIFISVVYLSLYFGLLFLLKIFNLKDVYFFKDFILRLKH